MAALWNGSKCSHTTCMLRFFTDPRLALNSNLIFEIGSSKKYEQGYIIWVNQVIQMPVLCFRMKYPKIESFKRKIIHKIIGSTD